MKKRNPQLMILVGAPGSGKSTFAKYHLRTHLNWSRVCRDDFRLMHFSNSFLSDKDEQMITKMIESCIEAMLLNKTNVIADATHTKKAYLDGYIKRFGHLADISFKVFESDKNELLKRCQERFEETGKYIPNNAVKKQVEQLDIVKKEFDFSTREKVEKKNINVIQDNTLHKAILCDLDGTLALLNGRNPFDATKCHDDLLNEPVANVLRNYKQLGFQIILVSGREDKFKEPTLKFLEQHEIVFDKLLMRKSGDSRKDSIIKREIFDAEIKDKYFIEFILDDRNQVVNMWRDDLKLPCFQVYYGDF